jgi:phenylalanyl-tRNA synthetase alpha chain
MPHAEYLNVEQPSRALRVRDLTDPAQGPHAIQLLLDAVVTALQSRWGNSVRYVRSSPIVAVRENYDRLGYDPSDATRAQRYTRYLSPTVMRRSHTSAELPTALQAAGPAAVRESELAKGVVLLRGALDAGLVLVPRTTRRGHPSLR